MKTLILLLPFILLQGASAQKTAQIEIPETYELANIILALTQYGKTDKWEVQKNTEYYKEVIKYFEPVKHHPLLDSVNYSRELWEEYLSFRTDAVAFSFDSAGSLKKDFEFFTNQGHNPFDRYIDLVNDFVVKSHFRVFFNEHKKFYNYIIQNYEKYNYIAETVSFLDTIIGQRIENKNSTYKIILSPLVYRMNCHRELREHVVADFPSATEDFVNGVDNDNNIEDRLNSNHLIFTEKDHEYINPITSKYATLVAANFATRYWDNNSGYEGQNSFNEYMTWAVYELFLEEHFPAYAKKLSLYWQYQNASRGFFAQNIFSDRVKVLYRKNKGMKFEQIYEPLLRWTKVMEQKISLPVLVNVNTEKFLETDLQNVQIHFSEPMDTTQAFGVELQEFKDDQPTGKKKFITIPQYSWADSGTMLSFALDTDYKECAVIFNWWGTEQPLLSQKGILLKPSSYILLKTAKVQK